MTLVEVVVAALVLALGAMATFGLAITATKNAQRAKGSQVALDRAQEEMEKLRSLTYNQLALTVNPAHASSELNPNYRVVNGNFAVIRQPRSEFVPLVVNGGSLFGGGFVEGGGVKPGPISFTTGDVSGKIFRYVAWRDDPTCDPEICPGKQDYKQLIVAVKLDTPVNQSGERGYVEVQSEVVDPSVADLGEGGDGGSGGNGPGGGGPGGGGSGGTAVTAQQFFLSDTPCDPEAGETVRREITGDHLLHNTLGVCADGEQNGGTPGAPDVLLLSAPPDPDPEDESNPLLYDYSDDFYLEPTPDTDKGVQIRRDDTSGCNYVPTGATNPEARVHRWVSDPMPEDFKMLGNVTLEFSTRSLNESLHTGTLCVYLFRRSESGEPLVGTDLRLSDKATSLPHWTYTPKDNEPWPRFGWTSVRLAMSFDGAPYTIPAGDRLGVALSVDRGNTQADAIPIMYDHPNHPTRIEVDTDTPIGG